ncbi:hypothetical protein BDN72DRAFT_849955 [Pluteus cervinus]|uniref:Uncharacterized protein n=1 Tax=Pluteus cervinus TaxID=181527 RepID=A0ACD3A8E8_9AGAR|nr:hypothetical protein BDN72DRAFT_849955 [Pluteus cervinus]
MTSSSRCWWKTWSLLTITPPSVPRSAPYPIIDQIEEGSQPVATSTGSKGQTEKSNNMHAYSDNSHLMHDRISTTLSVSITTSLAFHKTCRRACVFFLVRTHPDWYTSPLPANDLDGWIDIRVSLFFLFDFSPTRAW